MKKYLPVFALTLPITVLAQEQGSQPRELSYTYGEVRYLDTDRGGDGLRVGGSFSLDNNWLIVGDLTSLDYNPNVDVTTIEIGAGYVYDVDGEFDVVATLQYVHSEVETPFRDVDDDGLALSAGGRAMVTDEFEIRGFVHHINLDDNDTYLELAGDYYFSEKFSAGLSLEFAGDNDVLSIGARLYFR